ncbi:MAG: RlmE family RNA methyltransferase [Desulfobacterales bacterium]|nr:RlmE family RNA methyltransferase [Desulfobacterales bacterium]
MKNNWQDYYSKKAKKEDFPARSIYKLQEIQEKFKIFRKGFKVIDLGCSPGSWLLYSAKEVGDKGEVIGLDLNPIGTNVPNNTRHFVCDILEIDDKIINEIGSNFDLVLSDMAPNTTGNKSVDAARSFELCMAALYLAKKILIIGGSFVCKIFQGEDFKLFLDEVKIAFHQYKIFKPNSCRKASKEIYIIGFKKK